MSIEISATQRNEKGTGVSRRLRRSGQVPGTLYGGDKDAVSIVLDAHQLALQFRREAFHASILQMNLDGKKVNVLLRAFQLNPISNAIQHIDFQRISATETIHVRVPFHFIHEDVAPGVKLGGGIVAHIATEAEISCLAKNLPEFIEVDVSHLEMGQSVHLSQIALPAGVTFDQLAHGNDLAVVAIAKTRAGISDELAGDATPEPEKTTS